MWLVRWTTTTTRSLQPHMDGCALLLPGKEVRPLVCSKSAHTQVQACMISARTKVQRTYSRCSTALKLAAACMVIGMATVRGELCG